MSIESAYAVIYSFLITHQLIAIGILIFFALLLWRNPAVFFKFTLAILCLIVVVYIGSLLGGAGQSGVTSKNKMINETESKIFN